MGHWALFFRALQEIHNFLRTLQEAILQSTTQVHPERTSEKEVPKKIIPKAAESASPKPSGEKDSPEKSLETHKDSSTAHRQSGTAHSLRFFRFDFPAIKQLHNPPMQQSHAPLAPAYVMHNPKKCYHIEQIARASGRSSREIWTWYGRGGPEFCPLPFPLLRTRDLGPLWSSATIEPWIVWQIKNQKIIDRIRKSPLSLPVLLPGACPHPKKNLREKRNATHMGTLYQRAKQNFAELGETATQTDLANLASDFPWLIQHAAGLEELPDWLIDLADNLTLSCFWNAFDIPVARIPPTTAAGIFAHGLSGLWQHRSGTLENAIARTVRAARSPLLPARARSFLHLRYAYSLRIQNNWHMASPIFSALAEKTKLSKQEAENTRATTASISTQAQYWLADTALVHGKFRTGLDLLPSPEHTPLLEGDHHIDIACIHRENAQFDKAIAACEQAIQHARRIGSPGAKAEAHTYLAHAECWTEPEKAGAHALDAIEENQQVGNLVDQQRALVTLAIASSGRKPNENVEKILDEVTTISQKTGNQLGKQRIIFARAWHAAVTKDIPLTRKLITQLETLTETTGSFPHWADIARAWCPETTMETKRQTGPDEWIDGHNETMRRWRATLATRQAAIP